MASEPKAEPSLRPVGLATEGETQPPNRRSERQSPGEVARAPEAAGRLAHVDLLKQELGAVMISSSCRTCRSAACARAGSMLSCGWTQSEAGTAAYYALRLLIIIGRVIIPALVSLDLGSNLAAGLVRWTTFGLSLMVAISAAIEGLFRFGERWRHYRTIVERLKIEGWQFFQLSGPYAQRGGPYGRLPSVRGPGRRDYSERRAAVRHRGRPGETGAYSEIRRAVPSACAFRLTEAGSFTGRRILLAEVPRDGFANRLIACIAISGSPSAGR